MSDLAGKHIVVTGASAGIGAELCRQLGRLGCRLTLTARRRKLLGDVTEEIRRAGGEACYETCDVTERDEVFELAEFARGHFGEIDVWVSNAGGGMRHRLLEAEEEDMQLMFRLNCLSSLWAYQAVAVPWIEQGRGGQLIDVSSVGGKAGFAYGGGYCAAKHALSGMGDVLRQELARTGITLTTVYPGLTESEFGAALIDRTASDKSLRTEVMSRRAPWFVRLMAAKQPTAHVARAIVHAIRRPVPFVYPHRWAACAALLYNLWPNLLLSRLNRPRRTSSDGK
ncbi:SDR family NAD(P)-dependent oxidoreductase [bacterium]|nr:SDR family NAD(P)-dependent oxidoreductase [bacterium]